MDSFLQSPEWERFQRSIGRKTWRVQNVLFILHELPYGFSYLYCPHPAPQELSGPRGLTLLRDVQNIAEQQKAIFLKIDPLQPVRLVRPAFHIESGRALQPQQTIMLDLTKPKETLLSEMHPKTRYNIKVAEKHGIRIAMYEGTHEKKAKEEVFWGLLHETAERDRFSTHERSYYRELLHTNSDTFKNVLFLAYYNDQPIAGALINFYNGTAVYLHGASSKLHRNTMAPYLLHWRVIEEAKRRGCKAYDLWGIDLARWPGVTRFKKGFGGREIIHPEGTDIVFRPFWYRVYKIRPELKGFFWH